MTDATEHTRPPLAAEKFALYLTLAEGGGGPAGQARDTLTSRLAALKKPLLSLSHDQHTIAKAFKSNAYTVTNHIGIKVKSVLHVSRLLA